MTPVLLLLLPLLTHAQQLTDDGCYQKWQDTGVACGQFFERRSNIGEAECRALCTYFRPRCTVATFGNGICDLYDEPLTPGGYGRRKRGNGRGRRQRNCRTQNSARIIRCPSVDFYKPTGSCSGGDGDGGGGGGGGGTTTRQPITPTTTEGPLPDEATCPRGQVPRFLEIEGMELGRHTGEAITFSSRSPSECMQACEDNRTPEGAQAPCRSAQFLRRSGDCVITLEAGLPRGDLPLVPNRDSTYYEKICVDSRVADQCPGPYRHEPQHALLGFAETVTDAATLTECLEQCLNSERLFGFGCNSGMIFYEEDEMNCVLNVETEGSQPDLFTEFEEELVDYFELGCLVAVQRRLSDKPLKIKPKMSVGSEWGQWTKCDTKKGEQTRFRSCKRKTPSSCKEFEKKECIKFEEKVIENPNGRTPGCNAWKECCALLKPNGSKDCKNGRTITSSGFVECKPDDC